MACAPCASTTECSVATGVAVTAARNSTSDESDCEYAVQYVRSAFCWTAKNCTANKEACRAPGFASPLPRPRSLRCALHTSTRVQSTLDTHTPRVRASPAMHMISRDNTRSRQKAWLPCSSHWALAARRPARRWHIWRECALQTRSPPPLRARHMRRPHVVHAIHHRRCCHHRTQRHDDNDRDEDERHDEEDREHDGRYERVRFRSRLRLSRAIAHAHARCLASCT